LGQVFGFLAIAGEAKSDMVGLLFVALDQFFERAAVALLG